MRTVQKVCCDIAEDRLSNIQTLNCDIAEDRVVYFGFGSVLLCLKNYSVGAVGCEHYA